ncbi:hypothetical protein [Halomarina oriensis]|uniref:Uncharacterized protein n=1 Tax=Halomarina oriensis TaxID=671145 RepID=A0A6B0GDZ4_9EURY|nr:hypothetical protein [Halomarina oriensis]MWG33156.1 hypothetical protein [Halomarina oriensis]
MVSPCPGWNDRDGGYERDGTVVAVEPVAVYEGGGLSTTESVPEDEADAYDVSLWTRTTNGQRSVTPVTFEPPLAAWEFAHLLTWYVDDQGFDATRTALSGSDWSPPTVVTDEDAETVFRNLLGDDATSLDAVLD